MKDEFRPFNDLEIRSMDLRPRLATVAEELRASAPQHAPEAALRMLLLAAGFEQLALGSEENPDIFEGPLETRH